jgi:MFS family permease
MWTTDLAGEGVGYITVLTENVGGWCGTLIVITAVVGNLAIFNTNMTCGSRSLFVVADDNLAPPCFTWLTKRSGVPSIGILSMSLVTILLMQMEFTTLILIQVIPEFACAFCLAVMVFKARKMYPEETRRPDAYKIPGGKVGTLYCTISICCVSVAAFFLNGTDYFLYGVFLILSGIVLYVICKWIWGGPWKKNPDKWPRNPKTKLAYGDTFRIAILLEIMAAVCLTGRVALNLIEGSWGPEYYLEEYGSGLLSNFYGMLNLLLVMGIVLAIIGGVLFVVGKKIDRYIPQPVILSEEDRLDAMSGSAGEAW